MGIHCPLSQPTETHGFYHYHGFHQGLCSYNGINGVIIKLNFGGYKLKTRAEQWREQGEQIGKQISVENLDCRFSFNLRFLYFNFKSRFEFHQFHVIEPEFVKFRLNFRYLVSSVICSIQGWINKCCNSVFIYRYEFFWVVLCYALLCCFVGLNEWTQHSISVAWLIYLQFGVSALFLDSLQGRELSMILESILFI